MMRYKHQKRLLITTRRETQLLIAAKKLLFEMLRCQDAGIGRFQTAYQHLSILLEQYRYQERQRISKMGRMGLFLFGYFSFYF